MNPGDVPIQPFQHSIQCGMKYVQITTTTTLLALSLACLLVKAERTGRVELRREMNRGGEGRGGEERRGEEEKI